MKNYQAFLKLFSEHLEKYKEHILTQKPQELYLPENYILSLGGKHLRSLLALVACDLFNKDAKLALNSALAVELFHNFSLIHDDILDSAPLRRGKETVHKKWNTNIAILSGDVMLVQSFNVLQQYGFKEFKKLSTLFGKTAVEVCEGQQMDMNFETQSEVSVDDYIQMITYKTAVLLGCSLQMGAINAYASDKDQENIYQFGKHLGIAFQLMDDVLDAYAEDKKKFGKQIGGDIISNKKTFLLLKALELSDSKQKKELQKLLKLKEKDAEKKIKEVLEIYNALNIKKLSLQEADNRTKLALNFLDKIEAEKQKKENLKKFALELLNRNA